MRTALVALLVASACGPKVRPAAPSFDEEDPAAHREAALAKEAPPPAAPAPVAPAEPPLGPQGGAIERADVDAVLDLGAPGFLSRFEVAAAFEGEKFAGWRIVHAWQPRPPLGRSPLQAGDVVLAVNRNRLERPTDMQATWLDLRTAPELVVEIARGGELVELRWVITETADQSASDAADAARVIVAP